MLKEILRDPFKGTGKPEPLKYDLAGCWSRRLNEKHRIVYQVSDRQITFLQARYHYNQEGFSFRWRVGELCDPTLFVLMLFCLG